MTVKSMTHEQDLVAEFKNETVAVYGYGRTGRAVARRLAPLVHRLIVIEDGNPDDFESERANSDPSIEWLFSPSGLPPGLDRLIISPGIPADNELVLEARQKDLSVQAEVEIAFRLCSGKVWAITGTNGKSTCVEIIGALLAASGRETVVCGNRGRPFIDAVFEHGDERTNYVVEVSSFQVESMVEFSPDHALLTNLGDDHQDRHDSLDEYHGLKWELLQRTKSNGRVCMPLELIDAPAAEKIDVDDKVYFDRTHVQGSKYEISWSDSGLSYGELQVPAAEFPHLINIFPENFLAALGLVQPPAREQVLRTALLQLSVPPHRAELIEVGECRVINDSKGTTPTSVRALVEATPGKFSIILGGGDKGANFDELLQVLQNRRSDLQNLYLCAEDSLLSRLKDGCQKYDLSATEFQGWEKAVKELIVRAGEGTTVLLSPGGTSFDAFNNYRERGRCFRRWAREVAADA